MYHISYDFAMNSLTEHDMVFSKSITETSNIILQKYGEDIQLEAQWAEPVSFTFHYALRKLNTEPSIQVLPTKFQFNLAEQFQRRHFWKSTNLKQELPVVAMFVNGSKRNEQSLQRTFHRCFLPSFISFGQAVSEEKLFQKSTNQKQELPMMAMFVNGSKRNEQFPQRTFHRCFLLRFGSFGQAVLEEKIFRNQPIRNKNCLWRPYLLMDRHEMSNLYRGLPIDASYQVSVHLAKQFQGRRYFRNQPIRNKNCLWWPCLLADRDKMSILYRGPSIDASYQVSVHLAEGFQRRRLKC